MKIILTGGGSGGHFYPIIAIAEEINTVVKENHLIKPQMYYLSTDPYNEGLLFDLGVEFRKVTAGKIRRYFSLMNVVDLFKIIWGSLHAVITVFRIYPDVVFGKGGFASFPALFAARILRIPVVIHESDSVPGMVNKWAGKFAVRIAVSYPEAAQHFPAGKVAFTGNPVRKEVMDPLSNGAYEYLGLEEGVKTVLVRGGSQGAQMINDVIMDALPKLVESYNVIHQTGKANIGVMKETSEIVLHNNVHKNRYRPFDYLDLLQQRMTAGAADIIVSRAGSTIFEIASWGKPSIIIPITNSNGNHQRLNAYAYARTGAAIVIEEKNINEHILVSEINRILNSPNDQEKMKASALAFARRDSAKLIAKEILSISLSHEQ
ncbi:MAG: UDP-N-acetylglucosamine--N-acetylmuramyl-(pentapeptide) pyrophosphoryl-undecaprenol [Patescibacteria group bacterium]|nr:UDP-N-acetylglucosamine--N-acetylmuramyl-(pentapeptide) pyrophosphoryl-undecaprenol [Patescibacteria group bacterium]